MDLFARKPRIIPTFCIRIKESLEELDFDPDIIDNHSSIERLPDKSSIFSAELHALYLALDRVETAEDDKRNFIIFSDSEFYFTGFPVMLALGVMKRQMLLPRLVFREKSQMFQFLMVILKNTSVLLKRKW